MYTNIIRKKMAQWSISFMLPSVCIAVLHFAHLWTAKGKWHTLNEYIFLYPFPTASDFYISIFVKWNRRCVNFNLLRIFSINDDLNLKNKSFWKELGWKLSWRLPMERNSKQMRWSGSIYWNKTIWLYIATVHFSKSI